MPLSAMQRAFWFQELLSGDRGARAAVMFGIDFEPGVDFDRLDDALVSVVERHPLLRARVVVESGHPSLCVEGAPKTILTHLAGYGATLDEWCSRPVDLREWPPCRAAVEYDEGRARLRVIVHHAFFDAQSKDVFLRDLAAAYATGEKLGGDPISFDAPFWRAAVRRELEASERPPSRPAARTRAPAPLPRDTLPSVPCESLSFAVGPALGGVVREAAGRLGVTSFTLYLTAWHGALARLQVDDADVVTPIALSTRHDSDEEEIGPFLNQLPVRSTDARSHSFRTLASELGQAVRRLTANRHQPPPAEWDRTAADAGPEVSISYRRDTLGDFDWPGAAATPLLLPPLHAPSADVVIRMLRRGSGVSCAIDADRSVVPAGFARRLERCWHSLLATGAQRLDARVGELPLQASGQ